jgi:hypothetical protein
MEIYEHLMKVHKSIIISAVETTSLGLVIENSEANDLLIDSTEFQVGLCVKRKPTGGGLDSNQ